METYPVTLPCPSLQGNNFQGGSTFQRSNFDYVVRQRASICNNYTVSFGFIAKTATEMQDFKDFYYNSLNNGVDIFIADWMIEGFTGEKQFRFATIYNSKHLGNNKFQISAEFEMITKIKDL